MFPDGDRFDSRIIETNKCTFDTYLIIICAVLGVYAMAATIIGVVCTCTLNRVSNVISFPILLRRIDFCSRKIWKRRRRRYIGNQSDLETASEFLGIQLILNSKC